MRKLIVILLCAFASYSAMANSATKNYEDYFRKADGWNADRQYMLAYMFYRGHGMPKNYEYAARLYKKAAKQGHKLAQFNLGYAYYHGEGVDLDYSDAANWFLKSAEQGYTPAQFYLGDFYYFGEGIEQSDSKAYAWWTMVSDAWGIGALGNRETVMANMKKKQRYYGRLTFEMYQRELADKECC